LVARETLLRATQAAQQIGLSVPNRWLEVAVGLNPPMRSDGAIAAHAEYRKNEEKGSTPSPLAALFPFWADVEPQVMTSTLKFYLSQWQDYIGSPMFSALYGVWAAWLGDRKLSRKLMEEGFALFQHPRFSQTLEYRLDAGVGDLASGPFVANNAGFLTALLFGLPGLRINAADPREWPAREVVLPSGWESISCERLWVRGRPARLIAEHGAARAILAV
jgi:hypothetical protein